MVRCYAEPVDVQRRDTSPTQFLWRGRLYLVREVLAHWVESGGWWRAVAGGVAQGSGLREDAASAGLVGDLAGDLADGEREFWRVEAGAGRSAGTGVYDLCFDWARGGWSLARALD